MWIEFFEGPRDGDRVFLKDPPPVYKWAVLEHCGISLQHLGMSTSMAYRTTLYYLTKYKNESTGEYFYRYMLEKNK